MAAALPTGNLIVPVIKNADFLNLAGLTKSVNDLASRARQNKLKPEEIQDGTFTLTNVGTFWQPDGHTDHQPTPGGHSGNWGHC